MDLSKISYNATEFKACLDIEAKLEINYHGIRD